MSIPGAAKIIANARKWREGITLHSSLSIHRGTEKAVKPTDRNVTGGVAVGAVFDIIVTYQFTYYEIHP